MPLRIAATVLWTITGWSGAGIAVAFLGLPSGFEVICAIATAMLVWFDPAGIVWNRPAQGRRVRPIEEVAAELEAQAAGAAVPVGERSSN